MRNPRLVRSAFGEGERNGEKDKGGVYATISSVSGKIPENPKNKVTRNAPQKSSKIINIIKQFMVKSVFKASIPFSR